MTKVFTTGQVAKICKVSPRTVSKWFDNGRLKGYRVPGSRARRILREQLIRFLKEHSMPLGNLENEELYKTILVGTEPRINARMRELLPEASNYRFECAVSVFQAGGLMGGFLPDALVLDFAMGRGESAQIATSVRKLEVYANTRIIGLAGEDEAEPEKLKEHGFDDIFKKPFDVALLAEQVRTLAEAKRDN